MKITLETWNSVDFKTLVKTETKNVRMRKFRSDDAFMKFKEWKQSGLHYGTDSQGIYFGWPDTGYDLPAYRVREEK